MELSQSPADKQQEEIEVLRSIFEDDFLPPPPKDNAWGVKGSPEFIIRVRHPEPQCSNTIYFDLHVTFTQRYPQTPPHLKIHRPFFGLTTQHVNVLQELLNGKAKEFLGNSMIYDVYDFVRDWLKQNVQPKLHTQSLAVEMTARNAQEEEALQMQLEEQANIQRQKEEKHLQELKTQLYLDSLRREENQRVEKRKARNRGLSESLEPVYTTEVPMEVFREKIQVYSSTLQETELYIRAEPISDAPRGDFSFDLHVITFDNYYYGTSKGRKKLDDFVQALRIQSTIRHSNLSNVYAAELSPSYPPKLVILTEEQQRMSVQTLLETADCLNIQKTIGLLQQVLPALHVLHEQKVMHKGIMPDCLGICTSKKVSLVKLEKASWLTTLRDMYKSNPFGKVPIIDDHELPESWWSKESLNSPLYYTPTRDYSQLAVVCIQMLLGLDAPFRYADPYLAIESESFPVIMKEFVFTMWEAGKRKNVTYLTLLNSFPKIEQDKQLDVTITSPSVMKLHGKFWSGHSPEVDHNYHLGVVRHSRWREDWEELEHLGEGGFGRDDSVKARNKIDGRIYAVKKIKLLRTAQDEDKIFREVKLLSRLQHRHIVRYYTTWLESPEGDVSESSSNSDSESTSEITSHRRDTYDDPFAIDLDELSHRSRGQSTSFPSIHFSQTPSNLSSSSTDSDSDYESGSLSPVLSRHTERSVVPSHRMLYIQMRIAEGLSEDEAWRLFHQILDALVHMANLGILHRDIKCANIFIDKNNDVKIGDFGLATSGLVLPSESSEVASPKLAGDLTLDIGTRLYAAPSERIVVLENVRKPEIIFPESWSGRVLQRQIITMLLQHDVHVRPTAQQLASSGLLPPKVEDEYFKDALSVMTQKGSVHYTEVLNSFFSQPSGPTALTYDRNPFVPQYSPLLPIIQDHLANIFRLRGAVDSSMPLLLPNVDGQDHSPNTVFLLDRQGEVVSLPRNGFVPMARRAAQLNIRRIKRYHIGNVYSTGIGGGHPIARKAAVVDIITPDLNMGAIPAVVELLGMADQCLNVFPGSELAEYVIHITHTDVKTCLFNRIPAARRAQVEEVLSQSKASWRTKRGLFVKNYIPKSTLDEIEVLWEPDYPDSILTNVQRVSSSLYTVLSPIVDEIKQVINYARSIGVSRQIKFRPLMDSKIFTDAGVWFQFIKPSKRSELIAAGGRYDHMIKSFVDPSIPPDPIHAFGLQIDIDRIATHLAAHQSVAINNLIKEKRSFGAFSPRRCDVYIYTLKSFQTGHLVERLEVASLLWRNNISADIMYENALYSEEDHVKRCADEGILFIVYTKTRPDQPPFKVKSVLRETETGVSRTELVPFLLSQIAEQRKIDVASSSSNSGHSFVSTTAKEQTSNDDVQLVLLQDAHRKVKKPPKGVKDAMNPAKEKASDQVTSFNQSLRQSFNQGLPIVAADIPAGAFNAMISDANATWLANEEAWKMVLMAMPEIAPGRASAIRDAVAKKKEEGRRQLILFNLTDERAFIFNLQI
ncbi:hypothetical protein Clacol_007495 [Clathrus columnatus]|uniref:non-specific serine/threonine protein kinase n=1 Tax=Clathrus columnatus TaxID=1419009 RepID=A0AAV5AF35_9AGAM|nr:hypothetical protein Clacol_007495 [Clathrus columnatus]